MAWLYVLRCSRHKSLSSARLYFSVSRICHLFNISWQNDYNKIPVAKILLLIFKAKDTLLSGFQRSRKTVTLLRIALIISHRSKHWQQTTFLEVNTVIKYIFSQKIKNVGNFFSYGKGGTGKTYGIPLNISPCTS